MSLVGVVKDSRKGYAIAGIVVSGAAGALILFGAILAAILAWLRHAFD